MGMDNTLTHAAHAAQLGKSWDAYKFMVSRKEKAGYPDKNAPCNNASEVAAYWIKGNASKAPPAKTKRKLAPVATVPDSEPVAKDITQELQSEPLQAAAKPVASGWVYAIIATPTLVSVANIYAVSYDIMQGVIEAVLLTGVLSGMALIMLYLNIRGTLANVLIFGLIGFEAFANVCRIYFGLMGSGGNPTRFAVTVSDIFFDAGTHGVCLVLAGIVSLIIACTQYVGINQVKRDRK